MKKPSVWYGFGTYWIKTLNQVKLWVEQSALSAGGRITDNTIC